MLGDISGATNIYIIARDTDMRNGLDGLYAIVVGSPKKKTMGITSIFLWQTVRSYHGVTPRA